MRKGGWNLAQRQSQATFTLQLQLQLQIRYPLYIAIHKTTTCIHIYQNSQIAIFPTPNPRKPPLSLPTSSSSSIRPFSTVPADFPPPRPPSHFPHPHPHPSIHSPFLSHPHAPALQSINLPHIHQSPTPTAHPPNFQNYIHTSRQLTPHDPKRAALFPSPARSVAAVAQCLSSSSSSSSQRATRTANESFSRHTSCRPLVSYPTDRSSS